MLPNLFAVYHLTAPGRHGFSIQAGDAAVRVTAPYAPAPFTLPRGHALEITAQTLEAGGLRLEASHRPGAATPDARTSAADLAPHLAGVLATVLERGLELSYPATSEEERAIQTHRTIAWRHQARAAIDCARALSRS